MRHFNAHGHLVGRQIKHAFLLRAGPESKCDILNGLRGMERFPFCRG